MLTALIPAVTGLVAATSTSIAIDNAAKILIPATSRTLTGFGIKVGVAIAGGIIGAKISSYVTSSLETVIATVKDAPADTPAQEDN